MLALPDGHGGYYVHHAEGPFAVALGALEASELDQISAWVDSGTSSYTAGDSGGRGFEGHEVLRAAGANAVIVLPLVSAGERHGLLLVADRANHRIHTEKAELVELLAGQAAGSLRMAAAVTELRERASRDPLTGLGHHATFYGEVPAARAALPGRRVVVLLADVDGFKAINDSRGHAAGDEVLRAVAGVLRAVSPAHGRAYRIGGDEFAILFECSGEAEAWRVGWDLQAQSRSRLGTTMSIGLAIAMAGRERRAPGGARRRGALRGQAPRPRRRAAGLRSADDERVGRALDRHALEPAVADLPVDVELRAARQHDLDTHPRRCSTGSCCSTVPRRSPQARRASAIREPAGSTVTSSSPSPGSATPISEPPPNAPPAATISCQAPPSKPGPPSTRTLQRMGASVAAARSAPTA